MERNYQDILDEARKYSHTNGASLSNLNYSLGYDDLRSRNQKKLENSEVNYRRRELNDGKTQVDKTVEGIGSVLSLFSSQAPRLSSNANQSAKEAEQARLDAERQQQMFDQQMQVQQQRNQELQLQMQQNQQASMASQPNQKMMMFGAVFLVLVVMGGMFMMMNQGKKDK